MSGSERVKARLEELNSLDVSGSSSCHLRELGGLTQEQFTLRIAGLKEELLQAWNSDQRVKSLKVCIQVSWYHYIIFYPSLFLICPIVDGCLLESFSKAGLY